MKRRSFLLRTAGTALVVAAPRRSDAASVLTRVTPVEGFSVFAGPRMLAELKRGSPLEVVQITSDRAHAAVYAAGEQIGTIKLDSLGVMSWSPPQAATVHRVAKTGAGKHRLWIACIW